MTTMTPPMSDADPLDQALHACDLAAWTLAAIAVAASGANAEQADSAHAVLAAAGIELPTAEPDRRARAAQATAALLQASTVALGGAVPWSEQPDAALLAQGRASARGGRAFAGMAASLPGLGELLARPGACILDVGTGVGALAVACAEAIPGARVVGIDVLPRAVALARQTVAASSVADRVEIRLQDVEDLDETDRYAAAWVPAPFLPSPVLAGGLRRVAAALVPGGWLCLGYGRLTGTLSEQAVTRFTTAAYGGTVLDDGTAHGLLRGAGLVDVFSPPQPPGGPALVLGRRPGRESGE